MLYSVKERIFLNMKVWDRKNRSVTGEPSLFAMTDVVRLLFPAEKKSSARKRALLNPNFPAEAINMMF